MSIDVYNGVPFTTRDKKHHIRRFGGYTSLLTFTHITYGIGIQLL